MSQPAQQQDEPGRQCPLCPTVARIATRARSIERQGGGDHRRRQWHRARGRDRLREGRRGRPDLLPGRGRRRWRHRPVPPRGCATSGVGARRHIVGGQCRLVIAQAVEAFGRIDVLVSNAAYQMSHESIEEIPDEEWEYTFRTNVSAMFYLCKAALPHMNAGGSFIGSSSVNSDMPPHSCSLRCDEGGDRQLLCQPCATARRTRDSGEQRGPWADLDTVDTSNDARGKGCEVRRECPTRSRWPTGRARTDLRPTGLGRGQLRVRRSGSCHRRPADALTSRHAERAQIAREAVRSARSRSHTGCYPDGGRAAHAPVRRPIGKINILTWRDGSPPSQRNVGISA